MQNNLLFSLILNISLLVLMATVLTELRPLRLMIKRQERSVYNQLFLGLIFGLLSICEVPLENTKQIPSYLKIQGYA